MFDIGFWEIIVITVVALVVVGPDEFPSLVRSIGTGLGKARRFLSSVKSDLDYEIDRANEVKRLLAEEAKIAEMHQSLESELSKTVPTQSTVDRVQHGDKAEKTEADSGPAKSVGDRHSDKHPG